MSILKNVVVQKYMCLIINITSGIVWLELLIDARWPSPAHACRWRQESYVIYSIHTIHHGVFTCTGNKYLTMSSVRWYIIAIENYMATYPVNTGRIIYVECTCMSWNTRVYYLSCVHWVTNLEKSYDATSRFH